MHPSNTLINDNVANAKPFGISAALITPFTRDGALDAAAGGRQAARVIAAGAEGVTLCGTTGEGASLTRAERAKLIDGVLDAGVAAEAVTLCLCATAAEDAASQARDGLERGIRRFLATPPFYFKGVPDAGLEAWFGALIERLDAASVELILYHIPKVTGTPLSPALVRRLKDRFGPAIRGVKDSSGSWSGAQGFLKARDLSVMIGDERLLAGAASLGGSGSISGLANLVPAQVRATHETGTANAGINALVVAVIENGGTAMIKALAAKLFDEPGLAAMRAPNVAADPARADEIIDQVLRPML
ncbi:dihydrodipicolinate synthase family protein [Jiella sp. MQZ9-1]|uniref:Dihydrodipicolinate synthase family protein n=1 Tax=Jiella flava TaxID=2816857 RepID=A0A939JSL2_9HYPH|nr:dihydrodipicolinate synthase family protein [Jiella flava]MBO0663078.1 dihydrodipicolinate synthase family protein [Jiella flava]MCD2471497.1 dihydrodipicolinate synthase family protein [Jiella flava]